MPYIKSTERPKLDALLEGLLNEAVIVTPGELNYVITRIVSQYWAGDPRYQTLAEISGVLNNVYSEFYRRVAADYEDKKIAENGDVFSAS